ncbi:MAG: hypothetical protein J7619_29430 [Dyadobacter sp.]|uniref:hypothetical protein n=1 Tax=Dyadobacter sp. TaxID=1914288 RepID=UPI001B2D78CF|nr:hypothetical protein [Dyadobacter sp.]MBO9616844.1 hypothetical protein [Dyadobacter sp.]
MKHVTILLTIFFLSGCYQITCRELKERLRDRECNIVASYTPNGGRDFYLKGHDPVTGRRLFYRDQEAWYIEFEHKISPGDTVVKIKGELRFSIHKKEGVLVFPFECTEPLYPPK